MPQLEEIMQLRKNVNGSYSKFCDVVLSQVVGRQDWKVNCRIIPLREYASASDEAFGLLLLENSWLLWREMAVKDDDDEKMLQKSKYTMNGAGTKKNGGWKAEGINRFNELAQMVKADREKDSAEFETMYMESKFKSKKKGSEYEMETNNKTSKDEELEVFIDEEWTAKV